MATTISARGALLLSHALATWGWRTWEFAVALLLSELYPGACVCTRVPGQRQLLAQLAPAARHAPSFS